MLNSSIHTTPLNLDAVFSALADPTRRAILKRLGEGEATVNELKEPFRISQPAISKHLKVLEQAGLIDRKVEKQKRPARLKPETLEAAAIWINEFKQFWDANFDALDEVLSEIKQSSSQESEDD